MTSKAKFSRREFMIAAGVAGGGAALGLSGLTPTAYAQVGVRQDINDPRLDPRVIQALRDGVNAMKRLPSTDPKNWVSQASIHQNFCPHGNWFFLPWHRAYLYYFEQICRQASGWPGFMLPYWDWTTSPKVPAPFWGDASNPLFDDTRQIGPDDAADPEFVGQDAIDGLLRTPDFLTFASGVATSQRQRSTTGELEGTPHNYIHGSFVLGDMATFMSPLDPIFWLHHCNVDRLWTQWDQLHPNNTTQDTRWHNFTLNRFYDPRQNTQVSRRVSTLLSTYSLGYRYPNQPGTAPSGPRRFRGTLQSVQTGLRSARAVNQQARTSAPVTVELALPSRLRGSVNSVASVASDTAPSQRIRLAVSVQMPENLQTGVRLFINTENPGPNTPITDPGYVGTFAFFGDHDGGTGRGGTMDMSTLPFIFDVTDSVQRLSRASRLTAGSSVRVSVVPIPSGRQRTREATVRTEQVRLEAIS